MTLIYDKLFSTPDWLSHTFPKTTEKRVSLLLSSADMWGLVPKEGFGAENTYLSQRVQRAMIEEWQNQSSSGTGDFLTLLPSSPMDLNIPRQALYSIIR